MKNKDMGKIIIVVSVIFAIIILLVVLNQPTTNTTPSTLSTVGSYKCTGGQVLSISNAQIYTSSDLGGKKVIRVTFSTLPSAECMYINLNPSTINNALSEADKQKFEATNTVLGDIRLTKEQKVYNINERSGEKLRKIGLVQTEPDWLTACSDANCRSKHPDLSIIASPVYITNTGSTCYCAYVDEKGINGEFSGVSGLNWEVVVDIGSSSLTMNQNTLSGTVGSIAFAKWSGNLVSNINLDAITGRQSFKPYIDNQWRMIDYGTYTDLNNQYTTISNSLINNCGYGTTCNNEVDSVYSFNSNFDTKTSNKLQDWINGNSIVSSASISGNQLTANLKSAVAYPTFTMDIDASAVGIFITSGQPQVTCPSNIPQLVSGQTYDATFNLKNIGADSGSFTFSTNCNKGSQLLQPSPPQSIGPRSTISVIGRLGLTVESGTDTSTCTFSAQDINSLKTDSCSFSYTAIHQSNCIAGTKSCELLNAQLWTCKSDGTYDKVPCPNGCWFNGTDYECKGVIKCPEGQTLCEDGTCKVDCGTPTCKSCDEYSVSLIYSWLFPSKKCDAKGFTFSLDFFPQTGITCIYSVLKMALIPIVFIFSLLFLSSILPEKFKSVRKNKWAIWGISAGISILIGFLVYQLFLVGLLCFVGLIAFKLFVK